MNDLSLTVLMTTYNCGEYIHQAIKSIFKQTYRQFGLLIVDDGSTDNTTGIINSLNDERIKYIKLSHLGRSKALNYGLNKAKYDWVALMDADDICQPLRLEEQVKYLTAEQNNIVFSWSAYFKNDKILYTVKSPKESNELKNKLALHSYICNSSVLFNRNFILKNGGYDESLERFEDYDLWLRIKEKANFVVIPEYYLFMRIREDSSSNYNKLESRKIIYNIQEAYYKNFDKNFLIEDKVEQIKVRGWREYFYGDKKQARIEWKKIIFKYPDFRILIAFLFTYLPNKQLNRIREYRIKLRIKYFLKRIKDINRLQRKFNKIKTACK